MKNKQLDGILSFLAQVQMSPTTAIRRLIEEFGSSESPKLYPIEFPSEETESVWFGLYTLDQGRRAGRTRDLSKVFRVGGLIVDKDTPPALGVLEFAPHMRNEPVGALPHKASQLVRTNGYLWQALVADTSGTWVVRECIDIESLLKLDTESLNNEEPAECLVAFAEFLRRTMVCWEKREQPTVLASYFASHAREEIVRLLRQENGRIQDFQTLLSTEVGFVIEDVRDAAQYLTCLRILEQVRLHIAATSSNVNFVASPPEFSRWLTSPPEFVEALAIYFQSGTKSLVSTDDMWENDRAITEFCRSLLAEVFPHRQSLDGFTADTMDHALAQGMSLATVLPKNGTSLHLFDPNAGDGDLLLAAISTLPANFTKITVTANEANPLGAQILRLRCNALAQRPIVHHIRSLQPGGEFNETPHTRQPQYAITVCFGNVFRDGIDSQFSQDPMVWIGETRPHINRGTKLIVSASEPNHTFAQYGWGSKMQGLEEATNRYMEAFNSMASHSAVICVRLPSSWAEEPAYAPVRQTFCQQMASVFVDTSSLGERPRDKRLSRGDVVVLAAPQGSTITPPDGYQRVFVSSDTGYSLLSFEVSPRYGTWMPLPDMALRKPLNGPVERRGMSLIDVDRDALQQRLECYFSDQPNRVVKKQYPELMTDTARFDAKEVRTTLRQQAEYSPSNIVDYTFRPFDVRYAYVKNMRPLFSEPANELFSLARADIPFLVASAGTGNTNDGAPAWFGGIPCDYNFFAGQSGHFPVWIARDRLPSDVALDADGPYVANLSTEMRSFLNTIGCDDPDHARDTAMLLWLHAVAVLFTPAFCRENAEALRTGWPRIPIPGCTDDRDPAEAHELLHASAALGNAVAGILALDGCNDKLEFHAGRLIVDGKPVPPDEADAEALCLTANWGIRAKGNAVRPRPGRASPRSYKMAEIEELWKRAQEMGIDNIDIDSVFGGIVGDIFLNDRAYWSGIPERVWEYRIGGRQVLPKWLSYRDFSVLQRPLSVGEVRYFNDMVSRIIKLVIVGAQLDELWKKMRL